MDYVDKILKGATPADLPVGQPRKLGFVANLKTARALGLSIPDSVLRQATEILQQASASLGSPVTPRLTG